MDPSITIADDARPWMRRVFVLSVNFQALFSAKTICIMFSVTPTAQPKAVSKFGSNKKILGEFKSWLNTDLKMDHVGFDAAKSKTLKY